MKRKLKIAKFMVAIPVECRFDTEIKDWIITRAGHQAIDAAKHAASEVATTKYHKERKVDHGNRSKV